MPRNPLTPRGQELDSSVTLSCREQIRSLQSLYTFRKPSMVTQFLESHPFLIPLLFEACGQILRHFAPKPRFLEVVADSEAREDRELYALIETSLPPDEALERLDRFDKEWWLAAMDRAQCKLSFDVEFL